MNLNTKEKNKHLQTIQRNIRRCLLLCCIFICSVSASMGQDKEDNDPKDPKALPVNPVNGYVVKTIVLEDGDRVPFFNLAPVYCFSPLKKMSKRERRAYSRLVRDVKAAYPYAKMVSSTLLETYEYIQTLPSDKEREKHLKRMEKDLYKRYFPEMKKLTFRQGKILLKLIYRETHSSSYDLIDAYLGGFAANFWNLFAKLFGANLKVSYHPNGEDAAIETIVLMIESGRLS